jgi:hypothetical protein
MIVYIVFKPEHSIFTMENKVVSELLNESYRFKFESYGVLVNVETNSQRFLKKLKNHLPSILPAAIIVKNNLRAGHDFLIKVKKDGLYELYKDGENITSGESEENFFNFTSSKIRLTVAEFAVSKVFLHAGVVGWKGKGIICPARSFQGKTTLVAELVKRGALYYSDEYAILDENGFVHPFPKTLSVRGIIDKYKQFESTVESIGGTTGTLPLPVGLVLITQFESGARWNPQILTPGNGIMEIIAHTIPFKYNPQFSLQVLNKLVNHAIIAKSNRSEAKTFVDLLLKFYETEVS